MTRNTLPALVMSTITCASAPAFAALDAAHCAALKDSAIADTRIERAEWSDGNIAADDMAAFTGGSVRAQKAGAHCLVEGEHGARTGADGKHYGTRFQLRLPPTGTTASSFRAAAAWTASSHRRSGTLPGNKPAPRRR